MKTLTVTVGWTRSNMPEYSSFSDGYRWGASQHVETITLDMPDDTGDDEICELIFHATNDPYAESAEHRPDLAPVAKALHANGYRGQTAHWSLSMGDTVTIDGRGYACADIGWDPIQWQPPTDPDSDPVRITR